MKTINVTFTDEEHQRLIDIKGNGNWHDFIMLLESKSYVRVVPAVSVSGTYET